MHVVGYSVLNSIYREKKNRGNIGLIVILIKHSYVGDKQINP